MRGGDGCACCAPSVGIGHNPFALCKRRRNDSQMGILCLAILGQQSSTQASQRHTGIHTVDIIVIDTKCFKGRGS